MYMCQCENFKDGRKRMLEGESGRHSHTVRVAAFRREHRGAGTNAGIGANLVAETWGSSE